MVRRFLTDRNDLARKLADLPRPWVMALESSRHSPAMCRWLQAMGAQVRLGNAAELARHTKNRASKTDAKDAEMMLKLMRLDELPQCYLASDELGPLSAFVAHFFWALLAQAAGPGGRQRGKAAHKQAPLAEGVLGVHE